MNVYYKLSDWHSYRANLAGEIGFIPTMGALHAGHAALVKQAAHENKNCVASIFVNPTQFNNPDDLTKYPRTIEADLQLLESVGCTDVLIPDFKEVYADNYRFHVTENADSKILCGAHRPGHFGGVLTVVLKLLNLVQPTRCYMGEKDYQQFKLVRDMASALFLKTQIIACPTVRESDGLAMSSRNVRLNQDAREKAPLLFKLISSSSTPMLIRNELEAAGFTVDYVEEHWGRRFVAATINNVRLIDNVAI